MPVLPYAADVVAHTFWKYQHISTVHYENGQYHAHYQSVSLSKKIGTEKNGETSKSFSFANDHINTNFTTTFQYHQPTIKQTKFAQLVFYFPTSNYKIKTPPPEC